MTIRMTISPPDTGVGQLAIAGTGRTTEVRLSGFRYFWAKYVRGFDPSRHCAACLVGDWSRHTRMGIQLPKSFAFDESRDFSFVYLCGVSVLGYRTNLHIAMQPDDAAEPFSVRAFNGTTFAVTGGKRLAIPPLPDGWEGRDRKFTTCRNFQFGIAYFGPMPFRVGENGAPWKFSTHGPLKGA